MGGIISESGGFRSLSARGLALCVLQLLVTAGLPVVEYFLFYSMAPSYWYVPITTWCITCVAGVLGIWALAAKNGGALAAHVAVAVAGAALSGWFNTQFFFDLRDRCNRQQTSFIGCTSCTCAATNSCNQGAFNPGGPCAACSGAVGADVCSHVAALNLLTFMGVIQAVLIVLPASASLALLVRVESQNGRILAKLAKCRVLLGEELSRYEAGEQVLSDMVKLTSIVRLLAAYGAIYDRQLAERAAALWSIDLSDVQPGKPRSPQVLPITIQVDMNGGQYAADGTYGADGSAQVDGNGYYGDAANGNWGGEEQGGGKKKGRLLSLRR